MLSVIIGQVIVRGVKLRNVFWLRARVVEPHMIALPKISPCCSIIDSVASLSLLKDQT